MQIGIALAAGIAIALLCGNPWLGATRRAAQQLLALAVIGLGAGMDLGAVVRAGLGHLGYTVVGIAACLTLGFLLARRLRVPGRVGLLITVGTAICGGSAIAATVPVVRPREHEVSVALATVFVLNAVALVAFPLVGRWLALGPDEFGLWSAIAIHDTSSVVGAALAYGDERALAVATTVKLARALFIVPLTLGLGLRERSAVRARRPWFIAGFLLAAALVTWIPSLRPAGQWVVRGAHVTMAVTLFLIGTNLTRGALRSVGWRPFTFGLILWLLMAAGSLGAIVLLR